MTNMRWFNWLTAILLFLTPQFGEDMLGTNSILWWILPNIPLFFLLVAVLTPQEKFKPVQAMGLALTLILLCAIPFLLRDKSFNSHVTYPQLFSGFLVISIAYLIGSRNTAMIEWGNGEQYESALKLHWTALFVGFYSLFFGVWLIAVWPWHQIVTSHSKFILPIYAWYIPVSAGIIAYLRCFICSKRAIRESNHNRSLNE